jgi:(E)-2-((N-methylformamido)methylene)succinate hydrolase
VSAVIVFVHGVGLDHTMWDRVRSSGSDGLTYDLIGHGGASHPPGPYTLDTFVEQLATVAPPSATIVGFSLGALVAQGYAIHYPERVASLVLLNSVFDRTADERAAILARVVDVRAGGYAAAVDAALERWFTPAFATANPGVIAAFRRRMETNDVRAYADAYEVFATADAELASACRAITCPTLVVTGADDPRSTPAMTNALAAAIPGARALVVPGVRHMLPVERPDLVAELIERETAAP